MASSTDQPGSGAGARSMSVTGAKPCSMSSCRKTSTGPLVPGRAIALSGSTTRAGWTSPPTRTRPLVTPSSACSGTSGCPGRTPPSAVMEATAPCSWSSATGTTWEGMQAAWAKASTAVSSPTKSTVLVGT